MYAREGVRAIVVVDRNENGLTRVEGELKTLAANAEFGQLLGVIFVKL
jgi:hypothetical protein